MYSKLLYCLIKAKCFSIKSDAQGVAFIYTFSARSLAHSRKINFCNLPVDVFGISVITTSLGTLKRANSFWQCAIISSGVAVAPIFNSINAHGTSCQRASGLATTAAVNTAGCLYKTSSTSKDEMFSPPEIMMSFERSVILHNHLGGKRLGRPCETIRQQRLLELL